MSRSLRRLVPALAVVLAVGLVAPATARLAPEERAPVPGAPGIGDPYWPLDGNGGIDVVHYAVDDAYDFTTGRLSGRTTLTVRATADLSRFNLDLLLPVTAVTVDGAPATFTKPQQHELSITPAAALDRGEAFTVAVTYAGVPGPISYAGERNWLADEREVVAMNQPHMAPWWYAANDHPSDKATFDITVTGPATHQVVANGSLVSRVESGTRATTHWRSAHPMTTYNAYFALGRYRVEESRRAGLASYIAVSRELPAAEQAAAFAALRRTGGLTAWLASRLGRYPFESTGGLVHGLGDRMIEPFALENQTRPTYPVVPGADLLVHELAHQWFGDAVSLRRWSDIWLAEGFATFMEKVYAGTHGGQTAQTWLRSARAARARDGSFWSVDLTDPGRARIFDLAVYDRGAMTLQALRNRIGDARFWRLLRTWARDRRYGTGSVGAFTTLAERVSGQQLDGFFRAWLSAPRPPAVTRANGLR